MHYDLDDIYATDKMNEDLLNDFLSKEEDIKKTDEDEDKE